MGSRMHMTQMMMGMDLLMWKRSPAVSDPGMMPIQSPILPEYLASNFPDQIDGDGRSHIRAAGSLTEVLFR